jgi:Tol biopolymer transport system component
MADAPIGDLIRTADAGAGAAADELFSRLYRELHTLAEQHLRRSAPDLTLGATTLPHEAYLDMAGRESVAFPDRARFLAYASRAMRGLIIAGHSGAEYSPLVSPAPCPAIAGKCDARVCRGVPCGPHSHHSAFEVPMASPASAALVRLACATLIAAASGCSVDQPTEPTQAPAFVQASSAAPLAVAPAAMAFSIPPTTPATITVTVQYFTMITAATSDASCATVSPVSAPAQKPAGSSVYIATFTVTPVGPGTCTITVTDKKGRQVATAVSVSAVEPPRVVFVSDRDGDPEIYSIGTDGSGLARLTVLPGIDRDPSVSPDGSLIGFVSASFGVLDPGTMNIDGSNPQRRAVFHNSSTPTFAPDGSHLLVIDVSGNIQRFGVGGTFMPGLTDGGPPAHHAAYSPDGGRIVFGSLVQDPDFGDVYDVHVMNADGSGRTRLTFHAGPTPTLRPSFSPDGSKILYASHHASGPGIYLMNSDGTGSAVISGTSLADAEPTFSADGTQIAFSSTRDGQREIYVMNLDGSGLQRVTDSPADDSFPSFVP